MGILYGLIAVVCALICGSVAHAAASDLGNKLEDKLAVGFFATTAVICLFAGLDWMNLLPEM